MDRLDWDSNFWDIDIYNIEENCNSCELDLIKDIVNNKKALIQTLVSEDEVGTINYLEDRGFRFVQTKVTLKKEPMRKINLSKNEFKEIEKQELAFGKNAFFSLYGKFSRFNLFSKEKLNNFYYSWVINSIDGTMDDKCIGYYNNNQLAGFITFRYKNNGILIGLVGVFSEFQKRGISQKLLDYVNNEALHKGYSEIVVSTQGTNVNAINTYIKNGFIHESNKHWYYLLGEKVL